MNSAQLALVPYNSFFECFFNQALMIPSGTNTADAQAALWRRVNESFPSCGAGINSRGGYRPCESCEFTRLYLL